MNQGLETGTPKNEKNWEPRQVLGDLKPRNRETRNWDTKNSGTRNREICNQATGTGKLETGEKAESGKTESEESINEQLNIVNNLFLEANKKLAKAVEKKDLVQIGVAQAMLESAQSKSSNIQVI